MQVMCQSASIPDSVDFGVSSFKDGHLPCKAGRLQAVTNITLAACKTKLPAGGQFCELFWKGQGNSLAKVIK